MTTSSFFIGLLLCLLTVVMAYANYQNRRFKQFRYKIFEDLEYLRRDAADSQETLSYYGGIRGYNTALDDITTLLDRRIRQYHHGQLFGPSTDKETAEDRPQVGAAE